MNWIRLRWLALGDSAGMVLAIPAALLLGLFMIWLLPHISGSNWSHYRLTATVEINGQAKTVSQVYDYNCRAGSMKASAQVSGNCRIRGEAMVVDLGARGKLFVLMNGWASDHSAFAGHDLLVHRLGLAAARDSRPTWAALPVMVKFENVANPASVEIVDPQHLEEAFGPDVTLTGFTVENTSERFADSNITSVLPWLSNLKDKPLATQGAGLQLHAFDFKWPPA